MTKPSPHCPEPPLASSNHAMATDAETPRFRPIGLRAVAAGTRYASQALQKRDDVRREQAPGVLRDNFGER